MYEILKAAAQFYKIDPRGSHVQPLNGDAALTASQVVLRDLGLIAGDLVWLAQSGDFNPGSSDSPLDDQTSLVAVFSGDQGNYFATGTFEPYTRGIVAGVVSFNDINEDFHVSPRGIFAFVPEGATHLKFATADAYKGPNSDPDNDFGVLIASASELQGDNTIRGTDQDDRIYGFDGNDTVYGGGGDDELYGGEGNDQLSGGDGRDLLHGESGDDLLDASGGSRETQSWGDIAIPGLGSDTILGHEAAWKAANNNERTSEGERYSGIDLVYESLSLHHNAGIIVNFSGASGSGVVTSRLSSNDPNWFQDTFTYADHIEGTQFDDIITGSNQYLESFVGEAGNDTIDGGGYWDESLRTGWDTIDYRYESSREGNSPVAPIGVTVNLATGVATDTFGDIDTLRHIDAVFGSHLDDIIFGNERMNYIMGEEGNDLLSGGSGDDNLEGGAGNDTLDGGQGDDELYGGAGDDILIQSGSGRQLYDGGDGVDTFISDTGFSPPPDFIAQVNLATGFSGVKGSLGNLNDAIINIENVSVFGKWAWELVGDHKDNILISDGGDDTILGGEGDDIIVAGAGNDVLTGGPGADTFVFYEPNVQDTGHDVIRDFNLDEGDSIEARYADGSEIPDEELNVSISADQNSNAVINYAGGSLTLENWTAPEIAELLGIETLFSDPLADTFIVQRGIIGKGAGYDSYVFSKWMLDADAEITITDSGNNALQFIDGFEISSSMVAGNALRLTLSNGAVVTVLDADDYEYVIGGNPLTNSAGLLCTYQTFVEDVLGVNLPSGRQISQGGAVTISADTSKNNDVVVVSGAITSGTNGADEFRLDLSAGGTFFIEGFNTAEDRLAFSGIAATNADVLSDLDGEQGLGEQAIIVQLNPFTQETFVNFGVDAEGEVVSLAIFGLSELDWSNVALV